MSKYLSICDENLNVQYWPRRVGEQEEKWEEKQ